MKLRTQLILAPTVVCTMLLLTIGFSIWTLNNFQSGSDATHDAVLTAFKKTALLQSQLRELHLQAYRTVSIAQSLDAKAITTRREQQSEVLGVLTKEVSSMAETSGNPDIQEALRTFTYLTGKYKKSSDSAIDMASVDSNTGIAAMQSVDLDYKTLNDILGQVLAMVQQNAEKLGKDLEKQASQSHLALWTLGLLAIAVAIGFSWFTQRNIVRQIGGEPQDAVELAHRVANGKLDETIQLMRGDTQSLMAQLNFMQDRLVQLVASVRQGSENVATASLQIARGNTDLSARTEQQASSLEETAASMEELAVTIRQNADNAQEANQLTLGTSTIAVQGGEMVAQVVSTMRDINDSSRKIADIISVIDGIAFQTNILALNAAVEAARAGEQGRGFAVVASEVRSLAGRAASAAKEIKYLITTSVEKVEKGTQQVDQAGVTMTEVVAGIQQVTDLMGKISSASHEQSQGVSQVGEAVSQMDQTTQQNAALVEEMATAASSLESQAQELVKTVAVFTLPQDRNRNLIPMHHMHHTHHIQRIAPH